MNTDRMKNTLMKIAQLSHKFIQKKDLDGLSKLASSIITEDKQARKILAHGIKKNLIKIASQTKTASSKVEDWMRGETTPVEPAEAPSGINPKLLGGGLVAGIAGFPLLYSMYKKGKTKKEHKKVLNQVLQDPAFHGNPLEAIRFFKKIQKYSPTIAEDPDMSKNIMKEWHRMEGKSIQPEMIKQLMDTEKSSNESFFSRHPFLTTMLGGVGTEALIKHIPNLVDSLGKSRRS